MKVAGCRQIHVQSLRGRAMPRATRMRHQADGLAMQQRACVCVRARTEHVQMLEAPRQASGTPHSGGRSVAGAPQTSERGERGDDEMRRLHTSVASALSRIKAVNGDLNAVVHAIDPPSSSTDAGVDVGPGSPLLASLPILVKDSIDVAGMPTVCGLPGRQGSDPAPADAPLIARLRRAGAEIIGKTNVPAGCLDMQTFNKVHGRTNNPYDPQRTPGGSSGGSAAAVAAGMVELAIGSDLAGSLRVPASFCGVSSVKPTARRLSPRGHVPPAACMQNNLTLGALARDVRTLERFMQVDEAPRALCVQPCMCRLHHATYACSPSLSRVPTSGLPVSLVHAGCLCTKHRGRRRLGRRAARASFPAAARAASPRRARSADDRAQGRAHGRAHCRGHDALWRSAGCCRR